MNISFINISFLFIGISLSMSMFFLLVYLGGRKNHSNIAFSILCFMFTIIILLLRIYPLTKIYNEIHFNFFKSIFSSLMGIIFTFFGYTIFDFKKIKQQLLILIISYTFLSLLFNGIYFLTTNIIFIKMSFITMATHGIYVLIICTYQVIKMKQYKERTKKIASIGFLVLLMEGIFFLIFMALLNLEYAAYISYSAIFIVLFLFNFTLADRSNQEHKDLIELKQTLEQKVHEKTVKYYEANKQKSMLLVNIAHETKTPLTIIKNYFDLYHDNRNDDESKKIIKKNIDKMIRDIVQILDMEKMDNGSSIFNHNSVIDLSTILHSKLKIFNSVAKTKSIKIESNILEDAYISMDSNAASIVINNLLDNALKYTKPKGKITISLRKIDEDLVLTISDNGIGMNKDKLQQIFTPFYQISHKKNSFEGIGMGLSLTKKIIDDMGNEILVESELTKGSKFTIVFKASNKKESPVIGSSLDSISLNTISHEFDISDSEFNPDYKNILVVEDNEEMLNLLQIILKNKYNFFYANNGKSALEKIEIIPKPNLIISDIMMDKMDGFEFYSNLKNKFLFSSIPFIFLSARNSDKTELKGIRQGAIDFITKPFSKKLLLAKIDSFLLTQENLEADIIKDVNLKLNRYLEENIKRERNISKKKKDSMCQKLAKEYSLANREIEVVFMIYKGLQYKEIAFEMGISINTVETYRKRIFKKCNIQNKAELLKLLAE